jgi:hypothetical protein
VKPVSDERDRPKPPATNNLGDHHCRTDRDNDPGLPLIAFVCFAKEDVRVAKIIN